MDKTLFETLLQKTEGNDLDFKSKQYPIDTEDDKSEFIKDVLAFTNSCKNSNAYIICGVLDKDCKVEKLIGVNDHLQDNNLQQLVCSKTNRPPRFKYEPFTYKGMEFGIIVIDKYQDRPVFLTKDYGKLKAREVYIRHGSSTAIANPDEIKKMGEYPTVSKSPALNIQLKNKEDGTIFEKDVLLKSTILFFKNQSSNLENPKEIIKKEEQNQISSLNQTDKALTKKIKDSTGKLSESLETTVYGPDYTKKLRDYLQFKKTYTQLDFVLQNTGSSTANDVKTEVRIIKKLKENDNILQVKVCLDYIPIEPSLKSRFDSSGITPYISDKDIDEDIIPKETEDEYVFGIKFRKIQPKDRLESKKFFFIGVVFILPVAIFADSKAESFLPFEAKFEMHTKTFADNLPNPIEKTFNFKIEVNAEDCNPEELI